MTDVLDEARQAALRAEDKPSDADPWMSAFIDDDWHHPAFAQSRWYGLHRHVPEGRIMVQWRPGRAESPEPEPIDHLAQIASEVKQLRNMIVHSRLAVHPSVLDPEAQAEADLSIVLELAHLKVGGWVAVDHLFDQYGEGSTLCEAVKDLLATLYEDRDLLRAEGKSLSARLQAELQRLEETLPEEMP